MTATDGEKTVLPQIQQQTSPRAMHQQNPFGGAHAAYNRSKTNTYHSNKTQSATQGGFGVDGQSKQVHGHLY